MLEKIARDYVSTNKKALGALVDPKDQSYTVLDSLVADDPRCKSALVLIDLILKELAIIDKTLPEVYASLVTKANEFMMQVRPALNENYKGASGNTL